MNTIVLMGRLARDPETKLTSTQKGQTKVSRFPLVVKRNRTSKAFVVMITAYGNNAEFVEKYLEKRMIALYGKMQKIEGFKNLPCPRCGKEMRPELADNSYSRHEPVYICRVYK